jgi:hypothetical protein
MALVSPGVEVTIIDESNYLPAPTNSVPYILIATAQNKISGSGVGVAAGTTAANAGRVYLISSQRDLVATFGNPFFYSTTAGAPINGYELNEYGLLAAYSVMGISNRAYIQRADIDLSELTASLTRPTGDPANGTYWLDTTETVWGIFEWSFTTNAFTAKTPIVITNDTDLDGGIPKDSIGNIGDYCVVATNANNPVYFKSPGLTVPITASPGTDEIVAANQWVLVGSDEWKVSWPTVIGAQTSPTLTAGNTFFINNTQITVPGAPSNTVTGVATAINNASIAGIYAKNTSGKLEIYVDSDGINPDSSDEGNGLCDIVTGTGTVLTDLGISPRLYYAPTVQQSPNFQVPQWRSTSPEPHPTGSVWNKTNIVNQGTNLAVKKFDSALGQFIQQNCPVYANDQSENYALDPAGGGRNISVGSTYAQYDVFGSYETQSEPRGDATFTLKIFERQASGPTIILGEETSPSFTVNEAFTIQWSVRNSTALSSTVTATLPGSGTLGATDFVTAFLAAIPSGAPVTAAVTSDGAIQIQHTQGGIIVLEDTVGTPVADAGIVAYDPANNTGIPGVRNGYVNGALDVDVYLLSNWVQLAYTASAVAPNQDPADGRLWYYSAIDQVDIMINTSAGWKGYKMVSSDVRGYNLTLTDPNGPIISATAPTLQSNGSALVLGDLWINSSDLENYPLIYRYETIDGQNQWVLIDNTDQTTENGVLFEDFRWAPNETTDPITAPIPTITSLLISDYLDLDAPNPSLYPVGMLGFNLRRSGFNVKSFQVNYFNATAFPDETLPAERNAWVTASGLQSDGAPYMGRRAVRNLVVQAMKSAIDSQQDLREEQRQFNLIACPNYPELIPNMVALNNERSQTAFVVGDTPMRLPDTPDAIIDWATDAFGTGTDSEDGLVTADPYLATFYPSCQTTDLSGSTVVQPPSHMMLRTILRSDEVSFPWLAPAGTRRGVVDNAFALGYVDAQTGQFIQTAIRQSIRDTLYENKINPITFIPGTGITNYGNKTEAATPSALDRINVARLIAFLRARLETIGKTYVFEPNDQITRNEISNAVSNLLNDLVAKRGVYDYLVVCDESNNTPARIDRNELWIDIAIEPVKAVEFIYIPVRIKNTGEIAAGTVATASAV